MKKELPPQITSRDKKSQPSLEAIAQFFEAFAATMDASDRPEEVVACANSAIEEALKPQPAEPEEIE